MAINPQLRNGTAFYLPSVLAFGLAGILGVAVEGASDLLLKANEAAKARDFEIVEADENIPCTDDKCPGHDNDSGIGFHATTFEVTRPGDLAGSWSLRCVSSATADWPNRYVGNGAAELSREDLHVLLRFEFDNSGSFEGWTGIHKVWDGPAYDADIEELHL